ncbi:UNVERIFIED_CONTAM: hypothetical protein GTU68_009425 [Idotea baltica]|nr:hypothetical protein [Idotea baltica]
MKTLMLVVLSTMQTI